MSTYIYQKPNWPSFTWDSEQLLSLLTEVRNLQGYIIGRMEALGFELQAEATLSAVTLEIIKTSEIEGEILNPEQVRSSLARRLGIETGGLVPSNRNVDGVVDLLVDAIQNSAYVLDEDRLFAWHASLFPTGRSGMHKIITGDWRDDTKGPMQVVSGALGKEKVHFEAPPAGQVASEMGTFLRWFNEYESIDPVLKAGVAHLWFVTIHPFEDGNGRITRALTDLLLARSDGIPQRFYSMSSQIRLQRKAYYAILEQTQKGSLDITPWLSWFLKCLLDALKSSSEIVEKVMFKHTFWLEHQGKNLHDRQIKILNKLLDGFEGKLTTKKWAKMTKCSHDTALRDIQKLIDSGILKKEKEGGRSTNYELKV